PRRAQQATEVDAAMIEEPVVLGRQYRLDEHGRHVREPDRAIRFTGAIADGGENLRFERGRTDVAPRLRHARDPIAAQLETNEPWGAAVHRLVAAEIDLPRTGGPIELRGP